VEREDAQRYRDVEEEQGRHKADLWDAEHSSFDRTGFSGNRVGF